MDSNTSFSKLTIGLIIAVLVVGGVVWAMTKNQPKPENQAMMEDKAGESMMEKDIMPTSEDKMTSEMMMDDKAMDSSGSMMQKTGLYKDYSVATVEAEQKAGNKIVLFFHAPWCPFCKTANEAFASKSSDIPAGVTVLKTDYDSNTELRQKYGVTYQHTFVQIDSNGDQVSKWNGGDIDNLKKYLK